VVAKFALIATNPPIIVQQPKTQNVSPGSSALLTVVADGFRPFGYQWRFNDADLPGENSPMLSLTNVTAGKAGPYYVVISNHTGIATSEVARLYVNSGELRPRLAPFGPSLAHTLAFSVEGETGRCYRIEASSNLFAWSEEKVFPMLPWVLSNSTSLIVTTNGSASISVPANFNPKFIRASRYFSSNEICNLYLKELRFARDLWARDINAYLDYTPRTIDLQPYYKNGRLDYCPLGGSYRANSLRVLPECSTPGHILEEPR
jgi:hypothetical protein